MFLLLMSFIFSILVGCMCESQCSDFETCGDCISFSFDQCVWCSDESFKGRRCQTKSLNDASNSWCGTELYNPKNSINVVKNESLNLGPNVVQFEPQNLIITIRPGTTMNFTVKYRAAEDYPLDIYYLLDNSWTMRDLKASLREQGKDIVDQLSKISRSVNVGYGSFIEKDALPYATPNYSYSFRHEMSLQPYTSENFMNGGIKTGSNHDDPEAALDGLMQAMVCEKTIGWRTGARRIIIVFTDGTYHSAGDGKMVGAIQPNDMKCHLDTKGFYTEQLSLDYPSVSQINKVATEKNIKIIFAAKNLKREYEELAKRITGAKYANLKAKASILEMIKTEYKELLKSVQINRQVPPHLQLTLDPECFEIDECKVRYGEILQLKASIKLNYCPNTDDEYDVIINPMGLDEKLVVKVNTICKCDCEINGRRELNSPKCSKKGAYQCGVCNCNENWYGSYCNCTEAEKVDLIKCKENIEDSVSCRGRGTCRCGKCVCEEGYSGNFCEFDSYSCPWFDGKVCAGHGRCLLGRCECDTYWTGSDCSCSILQTSCYAPYSKTICSGNGECKCGKCLCTKTDNKNETYLGNYCDYCDDCAEGRCQELREYVHCIHQSSKAACDEKFNQSSTIDVKMLNRSEISAMKWKFAKWCWKVEDDTSSIVFKYQYLDNQLQLIIQREKEFPPKVNTWIAVGTCIGIILLVGILTGIIWKILVDMHDAAEYKRFAEIAAAEGYDVAENPLYQPPAMKFLNPQYNSYDEGNVTLNE